MISFTGLSFSAEEAKTPEPAKAEAPAAAPAAAAAPAPTLPPYFTATSPDRRQHYGRIRPAPIPCLGDAGGRRQGDVPSN